MADRSQGVETDLQHVPHGTVPSIASDLRENKFKMEKLKGRTKGLRRIYIQGGVSDDTSPHISCRIMDIRKHE